MDRDMLENTALALLKASPGVGSIHLNKGLLIIDAYCHSLYAKTLTGIRYVKHVYGAVPTPDVHKILYEMEFEKILVKQERKGAYIQNSHYAAVEPDYSALPAEAPEIIEEVAEMTSKLSAVDLSNLTHNEA
jgi:hypothetical protein